MGRNEPVLTIGATSLLAIVPGLIALGLEPLAAVGVALILLALDIAKRAFVTPVSKD